MWWANRRRLQLWQSTVAQLGLSDVKSSGFWAWRAQLTARSKRAEVRITDGGGESLVVEIEGPEGFPGVELRRKLFHFRKHGIEIGDKEFDDAYLVQGPDWSVGALLDWKTRCRLLNATDFFFSLEIAGGRLRVHASDKKLHLLLPLLVDVGRRLTEPVDLEHEITR